MVENLLREYDLVHSSTLSGGNVKFNINYLLNGKVYISLVSLINGVEKKSAFDFNSDEEFSLFVIPKIVERFLSKNVRVKVRKIMGNEEKGTIVIQRHDLKDCLIIRNCTVDVMEMVKQLLDSLSEISKENPSDSKIIFESNSNQQYDDYMKYNIAFDYASYKTNFYNEYDSDDLKRKLNDNDIETRQLLLLNIARFAYTFDTVECENIWDEIVKNYPENKAVADICEAFKNADYSVDNEYSNALCLAEFEKNNDVFLHYNDVIVEEALQACNEHVNYFDNSYMTYFENREKYYSSILDGQHQAICIDFMDAHDLREKNHTALKNTIDVTEKPVEKHHSRILDKFKKIKEDKNTFSSIINDPIENTNVENEVEEIFLDVDRSKYIEDAEDQARRLIEIEKERDQLRKDAEEFAKMLIKSEREHRKIVEAAEEQARKIIEYEKENEELRKLAEQNALYLFERDKKLREEENLREYMDNQPVKSQDIDKINNLLNSISSVKDLDFCVNHPTVMQELMFLEEKIITYLSTHKNIVSDGDYVVPIEKEEMLETKPVADLLAMIRNAYVRSHEFEKDGRHTLINFNPVDEDTYRVSLFSVSDDNDDLLMDVFFEDYQLNDSVLEELCDIFKTDAVIIASKMDNVPPDKADYLVIDNMDNAIRFVDCKKELIEKVKEYL